MEKIKKGLNIRIMSLLIIVLFIFNSTALYGIPAYNKTYLRTPLLGNSDKGRARLEEAISVYSTPLAGIQGSIAIRERISYKERTLKIALFRRGYDDLDNRRKLSEALDKEIGYQQELLGNTKILFKMTNRFSLRYKIPTNEELASNADSVVETWQDGSVLSIGTGKAQAMYITLISNILEGQGFKDISNVHLEPKDLKNIFNLKHKEQIGVLLRLPVCLRTLIRKNLENYLGKDFLKEYPQFNGYILVELERALIAIGKWMQKNYQGTDYGINLQALYVGLARPKDTADYLAALERISQMEKGLDVLQERGFILEWLLKQEQKSGNIPIRLRLDRRPRLYFDL